MRTATETTKKTTKKSATKKTATVKTKKTTAMVKFQQPSEALAPSTGASPVPAAALLGGVNQIVAGAAAYDGFKLGRKRTVLIGPGPKAIHVRKDTGEKVVRLPGDDGKISSSATALVGNLVKIFGDSSFESLDAPLLYTGTHFVLLTDAAVELTQNNAVEVEEAESYNSAQTPEPVTVTKKTIWTCGGKRESNFDSLG